MRRDHLCATVALFAISASVCVVNAQPKVAEAKKVNGPEVCTAAKVGADLPAEASIGSVEPRSAPVPHCRVVGTFKTRNPDNVIRFLLALPDDFNGRYAYEAPGGSAGMIMEPDAALLSQGFAVSTGDQGTRPGGIFDFSWRNDPAQLTDFNYRGVHLTARLTESLTSAYYSAKPVRYLVGCSGGGRSGRVSMRTYGAKDFDGVLAGAAPSNTANQIAMSRVAQYIMRNPDSWISPELMKKAEDKIIATYDAADGAVDGVIQDERLFEFDSSILKQIGFNQKQLELFDFVRLPFPYLTKQAPTTSKGMTASLSIGKVTEWSYWAVGSVPPPWTLDMKGSPVGFLVGEGTLKSLYGADYDWIKEFDFANPADFQRWTDGIGENAGAAGYDYSPFAKDGGKAIFYQGVGDIGVPYKDQLVARDEMALTTPNLDSWNRLYFVPGWGHCQPNGGGGPERAAVTKATLDALVKWVEKDDPPAALTAMRATAAGLPPRNFLLCPEPQVAAYKGTGTDINAAQSWSCNAPKSK